MGPENKDKSSKDPGLRAGYSNLSEFEMPPLCMFLFISGKVALYALYGGFCCCEVWENDIY